MVVRMTAPIWRRGARGFLSLLIAGTLIGPWPVDDSPLNSKNWLQTTVQRLDLIPTNVSRGSFNVGVAQTDLTPPSPVPLAGFIGQIMQPYVETTSTCSAKALTFANRSSSLTIVAADLLLIDERMSQRILTRTGLSRDQVYFTASHTHGGPGGWGNHPLERLVTGSFDPALFDLLVERIANVIVASRSRLELAEVAFVQARVEGLQRNRIRPGQSTNSVLSAWIFRSFGAASKRRTLATFAIFGAHATLSHPDPPRLSGDYPLAFEEALRKQVDPGIFLFAAGTVGDSSPVRFRDLNQRQNIEAHGKLLADQLAKVWNTSDYHSVIDFANLGLEVDLPPVQIPFVFGSLQFSPLLCWWVGKRSTYLHIVRFGPAFLIGFPGDFSGHLNKKIDQAIPVVATSFNGDYKGYLVSRNTFHDYPSYETRWMSFYGPDLGDYLTGLAQMITQKLRASQISSIGANSAQARS